MALPAHRFGSENTKLDAIPGVRNQQASRADYASFPNQAGEGQNLVTMIDNYAHNSPLLHCTSWTMEWSPYVWANAAFKGFTRTTDGKTASAGTGAGLPIAGINGDPFSGAVTGTRIQHQGTTATRSYDWGTDLRAIGDSLAKAAKNGVYIDLMLSHEPYRRSDVKPATGRIGTCDDFVNACLNGLFGPLMKYWSGYYQANGNSGTGVYGTTPGTWPTTLGDIRGGPNQHIRFTNGAFTGGQIVGTVGNHSWLWDYWWRADGSHSLTEVCDYMSFDQYCEFNAGFIKTPGGYRSLETIFTGGGGGSDPNVKAFLTGVGWVGTGVRGKASQLPAPYKWGIWETGAENLANNTGTSDIQAKWVTDSLAVIKKWSAAGGPECVVHTMFYSTADNWYFYTNAGNGVLDPTATGGEAAGAYKAFSNDTYWDDTTTGGGGGGGSTSSGAFFATGFESGAVAGFDSTANLTATGGTPAHGSFCGQLGFSAGNAFGTVNLPATSLYGVAMCRFRFVTSLPTADTDLIEFAGTGGSPMGKIRFQQTTGKLQAGFVGGAFQTFATAVTTGTWYRIDARCNHDARVIKWKVDDATQTDATDAATAASAASISIGDTAGSRTATIRIDDLVFSSLGADFPLADQTVKLAVPTAIDVSNDGGMFLDDGGGGIATGDYTRLTTPGDGSYVAQVASNGARTEKLAMTQTTDTNISCVMVGMAYKSTAASPAVTGTLKAADGSTVNQMFSGAFTGTATKYTAELMVPASTDGWTTTTFNGLETRIGYSGDAASTQSAVFDAVWVEYAVSSGVGSAGNTVLSLDSELDLNLIPSNRVATSLAIDAQFDLLFQPVPQVLSVAGSRKFTRGSLSTYTHVFEAPNGGSVILPIAEWEAVEQANGGFISSSGKVTAKTIRDYGDLLTYGTTWRTYASESGNLVYAGRLLDPAVSGGVGQLSSRGWSSLANNVAARMLYQAMGTDGWDSMDSDPYNYPNNDNYSVGVNKGSITFKTSDATAYKQGTKAGVAFWAEGVRLTQIVFKITRSKTAGLGGLTLQVFEVNGPGGSIGGAPAQSYSMGAGADNERVLQLSGKNDQVVILLTNTNAADATPGSWKLTLNNVRVWGYADSSGTVNNDDTFESSQVANDVAGRIGIQNDWVVSSGDNILPLDMQQATFSDVLDWAALIADYRWLILDRNGPILDFQPWTARKWVLMDEEMPRDLLPLERFDLVHIPYRKSNGSNGAVTVRADPDPLFKTNAYNDIQLDGNFPNQDTAQLLATRIVAYLSQARYSGTATFSQVLDDDGVRHSSDDVHAGDVLYVPDVNTAIRISELHRTDRDCQATFPDGLSTVDTLLARRNRKMNIQPG